MDEVVKVASDLVALPSMNPMGRDDVGDNEGFNERRVAEYVAEYLRAAGVDCEVQEVFPGRPNVIGRVEGADPTRTLVLEAHMDTVLGRTWRSPRSRLW